MKNVWKVIGLEFLLIIILAVLYRVFNLSEGIFIGLAIFIGFIFMPIIVMVDNAEIDKENEVKFGKEKALEMKREFDQIDSKMSNPFDNW